MKIHVDATPKAVGIMVKQTGFTLNIPVETKDIVYNELMAILIGLKYGNQFTEKKIVILTDNIIAFNLINYGYSNNKVLDALVQEINYELYSRPARALAVRIFWMKGKFNKADVVSRKDVNNDWHNNSFLYL